jgi:hypothetical protein
MPTFSSIMITDLIFVILNYSIKLEKDNCLFFNNQTLKKDIISSSGDQDPEKFSESSGDSDPKKLSDPSGDQDPKKFSEPEISISNHLLNKNNPTYKTEDEKFNE